MKHLEAIAERCSRLPVLDRRTPDEILGYDQNGLPRVEGDRASRG